MWFVLLGGEHPSRVQTGVVSWDFFDVFGIEPLHGRSFVASDDTHDSEAVLILSYDYWMTTFDGDPEVIGRVFEMNDRPHTLVGVLPPIPEYPNGNDVYMPVSSCPFRSAPATIANRDAKTSQAFGRIKPGVSLDQVEGDFSAITAQLREKYPTSYPPERGLAVASTSASRRVDQPGSTDSCLVAVHCRSGPPDCLRECRQPDVGASDATRQGDGDSDGDGGGQRPIDASDGR